MIQHLKPLFLYDEEKNELRLAEESMEADWFWAQQKGSKWYVGAPLLREGHKRIALWCKRRWEEHKLSALPDVLSSYLLLNAEEHMRACDELSLAMDHLQRDAEWARKQKVAHFIHRVSQHGLGDLYHGEIDSGTARARLLTGHGGKPRQMDFLIRYSPNKRGYFVTYLTGSPAGWGTRSNQIFTRKGTVLSVPFERYFVYRDNATGKPALRSDPKYKKMNLKSPHLCQTETRERAAGDIRFDANFWVDEAQYIESETLAAVVCWLREVGLIGRGVEERQNRMDRY